MAGDVDLADGLADRGQALVDDGVRRATAFLTDERRWDGRWLVVSAAEGTDPRNDAYLADLSLGDPSAPALVDVVVGHDARTSAHVGRDGRLYVGTDLDAPRGRLAVTDPALVGVVTR